MTDWELVHPMMRQVQGCSAKNRYSKPSKSIVDILTRISVTAFRSVLLIPRLSPRSTKPRVNISEIPMAGDDACLECPLAGVVSADGPVIIDDDGSRVVRFRFIDGVGLNVGTSKEIFRRVRFSIAIEAPVAGVGDS